MIVTIVEDLNARIDCTEFGVVALKCEYALRVGFARVDHVVRTRTCAYVCSTFMLTRLHLDRNPPA